MIKPAACLASRAKRQPRRKPVTSWACSSARWFPHPHEFPLLAKQDARLTKGSSAGCARSTSQTILQEPVLRACELWAGGMGGTSGAGPFFFVTVKCSAETPPQLPVGTGNKTPS